MTMYAQLIVTPKHKNQDMPELMTEIYRQYANHQKSFVGFPMIHNGEITIKLDKELNVEEFEKISAVLNQTGLVADVKIGITILHDDEEDYEVQEF